MVRVLWACVAVSGLALVTWRHIPCAASEVAGDVPVNAGGAAYTSPQQKGPIPDASSYAQCREGPLHDVPSDQALKGSERNTVKESNKEPDPMDRRWVRAVRYLRELPARHGRTVHDQMIRGASYSLGSGAVSLLILWAQTRH